jgi:hypothetical protein
MTDFLNKKDNTGLSDEEYVLKYSAIYLGMKSKIKDEGKIRTAENQ